MAGIQGKHLAEEQTIKAKKIFLKTFAKSGIVRDACLKAGISRTTLYAWKEHDLEFSLLYVDAEKDAQDVIRAELRRRGIDGVTSYRVSGGAIVYGPDAKPLTETKYSDALLAALAKARLPEFKEVNQSEQPPPPQSPISNADLQYLNDDEFNQAMELARRIEERKRAHA